MYFTCSSWSSWFRIIYAPNYNHTPFEQVILSGAARCWWDRVMRLKPPRSRTIFDGLVKNSEGVARPRPRDLVRSVIWLNVTLRHARQPNLFVDPENCLDNFRFCSGSLYYRSPSQKFDSLRSLRMTCWNRYGFNFIKNGRIISSPTGKYENNN